MLRGMAATIRRIVSTTKAPGAIGPYNQAVIADKTMYVSGQLGLDPETKEFVSDDVSEQAKQIKEVQTVKLKFPRITLKQPKKPQKTQIITSKVVEALVNMGHILEAGGSSFNKVVKTTVLLADINDFGKVNEVYKTFFTSHQPARAAYQVANLPKLGKVEIEAVAIVGEVKDE